MSLTLFTLPTVHVLLAPVKLFNCYCNRTPVIRTSSNKSETEGGVLISESGVGLNELEGSVLIDAEDYRRMVQEVKTLKTMLLRLKRELTADVSNTVPFIYLLLSLLGWVNSSFCYSSHFNGMCLET